MITGLIIGFVVGQVVALLALAFCLAARHPEDASRPGALWRTTHGELPGASEIRTLLSPLWRQMGASSPRERASGPRAMRMEPRDDNGESLVYR